ncbi:MAG: toll/interleukin-1 receptor domain-containing protein [Candidatus Pseudobacter hemicellulosilyticus]|uniref:ADP-ribosyl cyclase/cyclic ADP-ribose hydrolase n=1 Tax=Candidatus Pseudobacter hemicellulosilyticus TaxID=3121375 RepID=A0AAJ5WRC6_9BACT|nr:MAG: toll/interleukin-1 receptor domain-containing protein [Pseudobacter sp.]
MESQLQSVNSNLNRKEKEANSVFEKISKEKDIKRMVSYNSELARKNDEINRITKDKSAKAKTLADKQAKKLKLLQDLNKEEQRERDKVKREQQEILSLQQSITREMERQKNISLNALPKLALYQSHNSQKQYDVFVSHASEDKAGFVRPFVEALVEKGLSIWYDESTLQIGDSLRRAIENGLRSSTYGIVVLSEAFFNKEWPQRELDGLFAREVNGEKVILPIWHKISKNEVMSYSPIIADMLAINTTDFTIEEIAEKIASRIKR